MSNVKKELKAQVSADMHSTVDELEDVDVELVLKHLPHFSTAVHFDNLLALGVDVLARRQAIAADPGSGLKAAKDPEKINTYGKKLIPNMSKLLAISETTLDYVSRTVEVFGADYIRQLAKEARKKKIRLTFTHLRELSRLDDSWKEQRQAILNRLFDVKDEGMVSYRDILAVVNTLFKIKSQKVVNVMEDDADDSGTKGGKAAAKSRNNKADTVDDFDDVVDVDDGVDARVDSRKSESKYSRADDETVKAIESYCAGIVAIVDQSDKKFQRLAEQVKGWCEFASNNDVSDIDTRYIVNAVEKVNDFVVAVKDIGFDLEGLLAHCKGAYAEV